MVQRHLNGNGGEGETIKKRNGLLQNSKKGRINSSGYGRRGRWEGKEQQNWEGSRGPSIKDVG